MLRINYLRALLCMLMGSTFAFAQPVNDICTGAIDLTSNLGQGIGNVVNAGTFDNSAATIGVDDPTTGYECFLEPDGGGATPSIENTLWFSVTGDDNTYTIEATIAGCSVSNGITDNDTQIAIYTDGCSNLTPFLCNDDGPNASSGNYPSQIAFTAQAGVEYLIMIDGFSFNDTPSIGEFCIFIEQNPAPNSNDDCENLIDLGTLTTQCQGGPGYIETDFSIATAGPNSATQSCDNSGQNLDVFYQFTAPPSGVVELDPLLSNGSVFTRLQGTLYDACPSAGGVEIPNCFFLLTEPTYFLNLTPGETYVLQLWEDTDEPDSFLSLCLTEHETTPTLNDECENLIDLGTPTPGCTDFATFAEIDFTTATAGPDANASSCITGGVNFDVFYQFTAPESGIVLLDVFPIVNVDGTLYDACPGDGGVEIPGCIEVINGNVDAIIGLTPGATYVLQLWQEESFVEPLSICLESICQNLSGNITTSCRVNEENSFYVTLDITDFGLGNSAYTVDIAGTPQGTITSAGMTTYGPFPGGVPVELVLSGIDDPSCGGVGSVALDCTCDPAAVDAGSDLTSCPGDAVDLTATLVDIIPEMFLGYIVDTDCSTAFIDISTTGIALGLGDSGEAGITTTNTYNFYGTDYNTFSIGNNGDVYLGLLNANSQSSNQGILVQIPFPAIYPLWDNWDSELGDVYAEQQGTLLIIQWQDRPHFPGDGAVPGDGVTFQLIFDSATGVITFVYTDLDNALDPSESNGGSATVGIYDPVAGSIATSAFSSLEGISCISYTPDIQLQMPCAFVAWATDLNDVAGTTVGTTETITVNPTTTTTYYAIIDCDGLQQCFDEVTVTMEDAINCTAPEVVPTLGEWGLIILSLLILIIGVVSIRQRREEEVYG